MESIERFLLPIPGESPGGANLRYVLHDKLREARRQEEAGPMGQWEREPKTADYKAVVRLSEDALVKATKDLWIAVWLTEAWMYEYDLPGLTFGLQLVQGLIEHFWPSLYPELEDGDAELRVSPLEWLGSYFDPSKGSSPIFALRKLPLTESGLDWFAYQESRRIGSEAEVRGNDTRVKARELAIQEGKVSPEVFDKDFEATPKVFYKDLEREGRLVLETLDKLDATCKELFADVAPSFSPLRKSVEEFANVVHILLLRKLEKDPDIAPPPTRSVVPDVPLDQAPAGSPERLPASSAPQISTLAGGEIQSMEQASFHVIAAAQFFRRNDPSHPAAYLLLRAIRWGELRSQPVEMATQNLSAPLPATRIALRMAAGAEKFQQVLEVAETAMSTDVGRGWLDLQRYSVVAAEKLSYHNVAKALRSELKALLQDFPQLHSATLSDDTGTANPETLAWLHSEGFIS